MYLFVQVGFEVPSAVVEDDDATAEGVEVFERVTRTEDMTLNAGKEEVGGTKVGKLRVQFDAVGISFAPLIHVRSDDECFLTRLGQDAMQQRSLAGTRRSDDECAFGLAVWVVILRHFSSSAL